VGGLFFVAWVTMALMSSKTIKILSGGAMCTFLTEIVPLFERANGTKVEVEYRLTSVLKKDIADGGFRHRAVAASRDR
jgi:ABC-type molybdate transport system substrate-binding protein